MLQCYQKYWNRDINILKQIRWWQTLLLNPREFSLLIGIGNLTTRRIEMIENAGYGLSKMKMLKIYKWYGMSCMVLFEKNKESIIEYDRKVYRN